MKVAPVSEAPVESPADLIGIIVFEDDLPPAREAKVAAEAPVEPWARFGIPALPDLLRQASTDHRFRGKSGQTLLVDTQGRIPTRRVAVIGAGPRPGFKAADHRHPAAVLARLAGTVGAASLLVLEDPDITDGAAKLRRLAAISQGLLLGAYRFEKYLGSEKRLPTALHAAFLQITPPEAHEAAAAAIEAGLRIAQATSYARDLVNEPAGHLTPTALANDVAARATDKGIEATVLGPDQCRAQGMGMFLAVAQGSSQEPRFIHLAWRPANPCGRVVLVGKGVTFDSGGLSLKTNEGMLDMKSDMAGAAAVLAATLLAGEEKLAVEVHALAACTENMPSGTAYKLGDVLRSMSGKTVEINNTDAEGRLTLADALTYGLALNPDVILDFATLTGACVVALGPHMAGVMSNDDDARELWLEATRDAGEDMWPLPLPPRLSEQLKSEIADLRNTGERWGGALTAGLFLKEFVGGKPWIHVDLAGPATTTKVWGSDGKGATGFGVASIVTYLRRLAGNAPPRPADAARG